MTSNFKKGDIAYIIEDCIIKDVEIVKIGVTEKRDGTKNTMYTVRYRKDSCIVNISETWLYKTLDEANKAFTMSENEILKLLALNKKDNYEEKKRGLIQFSIQYKKMGISRVLPYFEDYDNKMEIAEDIFTDCLLKLWNSIPPEPKERLVSYFISTIKNKSKDVLRRYNAQKRPHPKKRISSEEEKTILDSTQDDENIIKSLESKELAVLITRYVFNNNNFDMIDQAIFKYRFIDDYEWKEIAYKLKMPDSDVKKRKKFLLKKIRIYLEKEGYEWQ